MTPEVCSFFDCFIPPYGISLLCAYHQDMLNGIGARYNRAVAKEYERHRDALVDIAEWFNEALSAFNIAVKKEVVPNEDRLRSC